MKLYLSRPEWGYTKNYSSMGSRLLMNLRRIISYSFIRSDCALMKLSPERSMRVANILS